MGTHTLLVAWPDIESLAERLRAPKGWCTCADCTPIMRGQIAPLGSSWGFTSPRDWYIRTTTLSVFFIGAGLTVGRWWPAFHKGHCHFCDYDLRGLSPDSPCPECGRKPKTGRSGAPTTANNPP
ncbi:MAG: hypothetical protein HND58_18585 [Planctomycetota bacterium]|nr:MAG: hypothetical protein HND58_18585 [Planctomycetota bacterium]